MKNIPNIFKSDIRTYGRQLDVKMKVDNAQFDIDKLNYVKPSYNTKLFKTVMHVLEIDTQEEMQKGSKIELKIGLKVNQSDYNYVQFNSYYVDKVERQEDMNSYRILAYTKMKEAMVDYDLTLTDKLSVREYLIKICEKLGWETNNIPETFINSSKLMDPTLHQNIGYTYRDALDEIASITCSFLYFVDDEFYLTYLADTNEVIDESYLDEDNVTIGEKYIINSLVFSRAEESDNIFRKNNESIVANGLHEYRISDCQLLSTNDRDDYIDEMFNYLTQLEFYTFDVQSKGILFFEVCDIFRLKLSENTYKVLCVNDEITIEDGISENLYCDKPEETETDYKCADTTDKRINKLYILANKQDGKITLLAENVSEAETKIAQQEMTSEEIRQSVSQLNTTMINDYTTKTALNTEIAALANSVNIKIEESETKTQQIGNDVKTVKESIKDMSYNFGTKGLNIGTTQDANNALFNNAGVQVRNYNILQAIFNYKGSGMDKLIVTGSAQLGRLRFLKSTKNAEKVTKIFHLDQLIENLTDLEV